ncbi:MAG: hypothetical protein KDK70_14765, partial [Myxococcales bacterium]|nr:hypothetical protein [Myxococcales bacterium]
ARVVDFGLASTGSPVGLPIAEGTAGVESTSASRSYHRPTFLGDLDDTIDEEGRPKPSPSSLETTAGLRTQDGMPLRLRPDVLSTLTGVELTMEGSPGTTMGPDPGATLPVGTTRAGMIVGTPAYMAPELFLGHPADARTDQFAFCVSLYEGLYGYRPFTGATASAIAEEVLAGRIAPPPERTRVPRWVHASVMQGLSVRRQDRHSTVRSLLASIAFLARVVWD